MRTKQEEEKEKLRKLRSYYKKTCKEFMVAPADGRALDHCYMSDARQAYVEACVKYVEEFVIDSEESDQ
tara:strand:+ start:650 stop:856 length:207 start_codon:yes stop_codon:yes gene_type:complete